MVNKPIFFSHTQKPWVIELTKVLGFGLMSLIMARVRFYMPGIDGSITDLREIALLISLFYFRHWLPIILISLITALGTPPEFSAISNFLMHVYPLLITYFIFKFLNKKINNRIYISIFWLFVVGCYFYLLNIPVMLLNHYYMGLINDGGIVDEYIKLAEMLRFEIFATAIITSLYLFNIKTAYLLKQQNADLIKSKQKAEESDRLKTAFLQNLSHEIRTPMNGIIGFSHLLQVSHDSSGQIIKYTELIVNSGNQLLHIVDDIIDASKIETMQTKLILSKKSLNELINEVKITFELKYSTQSQKITIIPDYNNSMVIKTDVYKISRIIYHLVDNALKFSDDNIIIKCSLSNNLLEFSISDNGIGIDKKDRDIIFNSFCQLNSELLREYSGNGLGLSISKGFVTFLKGNIWLESELGKGSTFFVKIPVETITGN